LYLHPTDVSDARALWVNPAGLGHFPEASVHLDLTVGDPGAKGQLRQLTLGLNSRGLSLGYQRDLFSSGRRGHTYKLGYAAGRGGLAAGFATALYRGGTSGTGWDVGILYDWTPALSIGGVIQTLGQPVVADSTLRLTYVPSATLQLAGRRVVLSALSRLTSDGVTGYGFGLRGTLRAGTSLPLGLLARLDTDRSLRRGGFAFGFSLGAADMAGLVATTPEQQRAAVGAPGRKQVQDRLSGREGTLAPQGLGETVGDGRADREAGSLRQDREREDQETPYHPEAHERVESPGQDGGTHPHAVLRRGRESLYQGPAQLLGGLEALGGVLGECPIDHRGERGRHIAPVVSDRHRGGGGLLHEDRLGGLAVERWDAGEHLIQHDPERVNVRTGVYVLSGGLLGTHVVRGPDHHALGGELAGGRLLRGLRDPEVGHEHVARAIEQDVVGLHVAVHDAVEVRVAECVGYLPRDAGGIPQREALMLLEQLAERRSVEAAH